MTLLNLLQLNVDIRSQIATDSFGGNVSIGSIVSSVVGVAITLSGVAVMIFLIWGGYEWLTSGGDKAKIDSARSKITNAVIGIAIVASAFTIYSLVDKFFGIGNVTESNETTPGPVLVCQGAGCVDSHGCGAPPNLADDCRCYENPSGNILCQY